MSFIRPEARAVLRRWRGALVGLAVLALGLWWASGHGLMRWLGGGVAVLGLLLLVTAVQRARFRAGRGGPGVVRVDEGEVTYFGPLDGGAVALRDLESLVLDGASRPPVWVLRQAGRPALHIPVNAEGAERLFDAFASLPGLRTGFMLARMQAPPAQPVVIWRKAGVRHPALSVH